MFKSSSNIEKEFRNLRKNLLDLTLRNQLLNFKSRAKTISIVNQTPLNIYQTLILQNRKMYFVANKKEKEDKSKFSIWDHSPIDLSRFTNEGDKTLQTNLTPNELQKRSFYINQQAKTMLEEQGYNVLYLAVGFLEWYDKSKPKQKNLAPLILIPVAMERKTIGQSFELDWTGEEIHTNISLKAKLKEAGITLPEFKQKNYGEALEHYIKEVSEAVSRQRDWVVNSDIALGFFSFTKFVMYNDLNPDSWDDNVDLTKNELIEAIFNPSKNKQEAFHEEDIDAELRYENMYQVLDADSSQIAAIEDVKSGRNLVVEGPPGTGKSQTIVNLIAELLAEGKSVLFVSEKMAALDVVKDRLTKVGLGKFVLELHSHKTRRKKFLKNLKKATNNREEEVVKSEQTLRKLESLRKQLDDYAEIIHEPLYAVKLSAFQLYGLKESADAHFAKQDKIIPLVRFENPQDYTLKDLDDITLSLENVAELYQTISKENPWSKCAPKSLLPADLREIEILINDTLFDSENFIGECDKVYDIYGIKKPENFKEFEKTLKAFDLIDQKNMALIDARILSSDAWRKSNNDLNSIINKLEDYQKTKNIFDKFNDNIRTADIDFLISELNKLSHKKFRLFKSKQNNELVEIYYKSSIPSTEGIINDLNKVKENINYRKELEANNDLAVSYFGQYWSFDADIKDLKTISNWMMEFNRLMDEGLFSENTIEVLSKDLFNINPKVDLVDYIDSGNKFKQSLSKLESKLNPRCKLIFKKDSDEVSFKEWRDQLQHWRGQLSSLHLWSQYLNTKNTCKGTHSEPFIEAIEKRNIKKDDVKSLVLGNFADSLLNIIFLENQALSSFIGELHENRIEEFKDLDKAILEINRKRIYHKLNQNIPEIYGNTDDPEAKILAGEFTRKSGHLPVRKLLDKAGGMIKQIKPCFMMSPLSIAQYLDPTNEKLQFDVVIFDEASQVKPEDALGAFMRAKTAVVMGDTQQLPPTSFFEQLSAGESGEEVATSLDMESILHLCKLSFPVKMLKWHYRSRHESLINVSNKEFYDEELLVYPSPCHDDPELGLKFNYNPNTHYLRGKSSANPEEAKDVVREIFNHFEKYGDTKSLGVGTFSVAQRNAILEELEIERKNRPELEQYFSDNKEEHFFVKNLETIQGDERDVIFISVGYGYDQFGKMSLNFGPLNQDGGERRLNVLITRAREKCVVFSNFKAYDMHLTANPPFGVKSLKEFLEYAENLTLGTLTEESYPEEPFEDAIYSFLTENGYTVHKQVGCAGFRVDLAIVDEENPGKYFLGITTDGKMYASSKVARDRDRLREQVLKGLGWKLYHLWSTDWYRNRDLGRQKLLAAIEKAKKETREEEKRKSEEAKAFALKRKEEAEKRAEELRLAKEKEEAEKKAKETEDNDEYVVVSDDIDNEDEDIVDSHDNKNDDYIIVSDNNESDEDEDIVDSHDNKNDDKEYIVDSDNETDNDFDELEPVINVKDVNLDEDEDDEDFIIPKEKVIPREISEDENIVVIEDDEDDFVSNLTNKAQESINKTINTDEKELDSKDLNIENNDINQTHDSDKSNKFNLRNIFKRSNDDIENDDEIGDDVDYEEAIQLDKPKKRDKYVKKSLEDINNFNDNENEDLVLEKPTTINKEPINIKFKSNIDFDEDDINSNFSEEYSKINDELNEKENEDIENYEEDFKNNENYDNNQSDYVGIDTFNDDNEDIEYENAYQGATDINNPLRKNNLYYNKKDNDSKKTVRGTINEIKEEMKYLNKSLKEIENPTQIDYVQVIDRTEDYDPYRYESEYPSDSIESSTENHSENDENYPINETISNYEESIEEPIIPIHQDTNYNNVEEDKDLIKAIKNEIENDTDVIIPIHQEMKKDNKEEQVLEHVIQDIDESYKELEKERYLENNTLKDYDDKKLPKKGETIEDNIKTYAKVKNVAIASAEDLYNKESSEISPAICEIVKVEGPIHTKELMNRIKESCDIKRVSSKLKNSVNSAIEYSENTGNIIKIGDFLYDSLNPEINIRKRDKPNIDLISPEEIQKNIEVTLSIKKSLSSKELTKQVARNFGFKSTSKKTSTRINTILDSMIADGKVNLDNDILELN